MKALERHSASVFVAITILLAGCSRATENHDTDSGAAQGEDYHADNDIAMVVSSLTDAIRVEEPLDTTDYDFAGVLTDGQGHPLYTTTQGYPGEWEVDVLSETSAVIRNVDIGDLLPDDLTSYIISTLGLTPMDMIHTGHLEDDDEAEARIYDLRGGFLRIETRKGEAPNGLEGPLMQIMVSRRLPGSLER